MAIAPEGPRAVSRYWQQHGLPFLVIADPDHRLAGLFGQEFQLRKLGRLPAVLILDRGGVVRATWYGQSMRDLPTPEDLLRVLDEIADSSSPVAQER